DGAPEAAHHAGRIRPANRVRQRIDGGTVSHTPGSRLLPTSFWAPSERLFFELLVNEIARELIGLVPAFQRAGVSPPTVQNAERELPLCDVGIAHITHFILA